MRYIDFVHAVFSAAVRAVGADYNARLIGANELEVLKLLDLGIDPASAEFWNSAAHRACIAAIQDLDDLSVISADGHLVKVGDYGREIHQAGMPALWSRFFAPAIDAESADFLRALTELAEVPGDRFVGLNYPTVAEVFQHLGWPWSETEITRVVFIHSQLEDAGLARGVRAGGGFIHGLAPTYGGFVRVTQQEPTAIRELVSGLVPEWETTTVEFKREIPLAKANQKAEFVKNLCALATTKASGARRYLVIGFDPKSHAFVQSVDPTLTQDRIEQLLNAHADPRPDVRLYTAPYEQGQVGVILVARDPARVPYRLRPAATAFFGGRDVFVRHGSQVEAPTDAELRDLIDEGRRARAPSP